MIVRDRSIKKIKHSSSLVEIHAIETWGTSNEREWTLRCHEEPRLEMPAAFKALVPLVRDLLGLPLDWAKDALSVISVSLSYSEITGVQGASICMRADLECATSPLIFNTPHLPFDQYSEGGKQPVMPDDLIEALQVLEREAEAYLDGSRAQADLFEAPVRRGKDAAAGELVGA